MITVNTSGSSIRILCWLIIGLSFLATQSTRADSTPIPLLALSGSVAIDGQRSRQETDLYIEQFLYNYDPDFDDVEPAQLNLIEKQLIWLLDTRNSWSDWVANTGSRLDAYFAGEQTQSFTNTSFLRVRLGPTYKKKGNHDFAPDIKFKLNLPLTKDKYRLIVENHPSEGKSLRTRTAEQIEGAEDEENDTTGSLRIISELRKNWTLTNDIGIKFHFPPDPFFRSRASNGWQLDNDWYTSVQASVYYLLSEDLGANIVNNLDRQLTDTLFFRNTFETQWSRDKDNYEFSNSFNLFQELDNHRVIRYKLATLVESKPHPFFSDFYLELTYRQKLYRNWLFFEVTPLLSLPEHDDYGINPSITFKLEVLFSKKR
ncbi:MAG: hypothetical protein CSA52_03335 [Gammaproteobacteria bacterium]|nr:MAG: hypothetical protein CSB48_04065 [Pseudomonadota bacterium]PIE38227.1 MAG: hypothetical protein CSA52_03335 [Gammaproteobacteria bacterium]